MLVSICYFPSCCQLSIFFHLTFQYSDEAGLLLFPLCKKWRLRKESQDCKVLTAAQQWAWAQVHTDWPWTLLPLLPHCLLRTITRLLTPTPKTLLALSSRVRHDREECGISVSYDHFFSTLRFFLEQSDWFPQPGYWFCNYRDETSCHLSACLLPKICFQFLEDWISSFFFLECLKAMFLT